MADSLSRRAFAIAVITAALLGMLATLALRPPGGQASSAKTDDAAAFEKVNWRVASAFGTNLPIIGEAPTHVAEILRKASGNRTVLTIYEPAELVPAFSITESVKDQKIAAGFTWVGYDQGRIPSSALLGAVPFGMEPWEYLAWWREGGGRSLGEALYNPIQVQPILCGIVSPETAGWFREPIERIEDLQGLKIRFAGLGGKVLQRLGASVTMIPAGEIFQALEKGAIDATEFSLPVIDKMLGFDRVAGFNYFPGWHQPFTSLHLLVNLQIWQALRPETRALIEMACDSAITFSLAKAEALQGEVIERFKASGTVSSVLPDPVLLRLREATEAVLQEEAQADAMFARILQSQQDFSQSYEIWKQLGYLPRDF